MIRPPRKRSGERLTIYLDPKVSQFFNTHGVSPKVFLEGLLLDLCLIEGDDSEEHALIKSYFDYVQRDPQWPRLRASPSISSQLLATCACALSVH
jgi:hypothetical protein